MPIKLKSSRVCLLLLSLLTINDVLLNGVYMCAHKYFSTDVQNHLTDASTAVKHIDSALLTEKLEQGCAR